MSMRDEIVETIVKHQTLRFGTADKRNVNEQIADRILAIVQRRMDEIQNLLKKQYTDCRLSYVEVPYSNYNKAISLCTLDTPPAADDGKLRDIRDKWVKWIDRIASAQAANEFADDLDRIMQAIKEACDGKD